MIESNGSSSPRCTASWALAPVRAASWEAEELLRARRRAGKSADDAARFAERAGLTRTVRPGKVLGPCITTEAQNFVIF